MCGISWRLRPRSMSSNSDEPILVDTKGPTWVATFADVGTVRIGPDGRVCIDVVDGPEAQQRRRALEWGWGEPLNFLRRGFRLAEAVVADPEAGGLLVSGGSWEMLPMLKALTDEGWAIVSDSLTPVRWAEGALFSHPRQAPILASDRFAEKWELMAEPLRSDSDTVAVSLPRAEAPVPVRAILVLAERKVRDAAGVRPVVGAKRLKLAAALLQSGPGDDPDPAELLADDLRLSALPMAELAIGDKLMADHAREVVEWWTTVSQ